MGNATPAAQKRADEFQTRLSSRGFRSTRQRARIAEIFFDMGGHRSVEEIYSLLREQTEGAGHATIYRTMKLLVDCGMAKARHFGDGLTRYEPFEEGEHHDHLICIKCGTIVEFENETIENLQDAIALQHGFTLTHHRMELYGLCSTCD